MLESTERVNEGADPADEEAIPADEGAKQVSKVTERRSEATKPTDEGAEQANEAADQTESLEAGAAATTPLQILRTFTEIENAPENATKIAVAEIEKSENSVRQLWVPFVLQSASILLFIGAFTISLICIIILFIISNRRNGIASVNSKYYYLWTYGPTAGKLIFIRRLKM
jgi:hypothetical protein